MQARLALRITDRDERRIRIVPGGSVLDEADERGQPMALLIGDKRGQNVGNTRSRVRHHLLARLEKNA